MIASCPCASVSGRTMAGIEIVLIWTLVPRMMVGGVMSQTQPASERCCMALPLIMLPSSPIALAARASKLLMVCPSICEAIRSAVVSDMP